ncbi:MAG: phosphoribosylamine--glycine ligase, partial [Pseudomonadota bacterium]
MKVLILGGGGREHALAWKIARSPIVTTLYCAPGNAGIAQVAKCVDGLDIESGGAVVAFCQRIEIGFVVIGPEAPLAAGVADALRANGIGVFGPSKAAAQLEASKAFTKEICDACGAPTAAWGRFSEEDAALAYVREKGAPIVIKADGLAAGKGVVVAQTLAEAEAAIKDMFAGG